MFSFQFSLFLSSALSLSCLLSKPWKIDIKLDLSLHYSKDMFFWVKYLKIMFAIVQMIWFVWDFIFFNCVNLCNEKCSRCNFIMQQSKTFQRYELLNLTFKKFWYLVFRNVDEILMCLFVQSLLTFIIRSFGVNCL